MEGDAARLTDDLYHYTSADVGVDSVLRQMQFRFGLIESTNDPRESRPHYPPLSGNPKKEHDDLLPLWMEADNLLRRSAKVGCFTLDYELPDSALNSEMFRGYAHPALWAHYGARHAGVCLRFSRSQLTARIREVVGDRGRLFEGNVEYVGDPWLDVLPETLDLAQIYEFGLDAVVARFIERHHHALFFRKHWDWSGEREYRWVWVDPEPLPLYVDVGGCITAVVLGDAFPSARLSGVYSMARSHGLDVTQVHFQRGQPRLHPGPHSGNPFELAPNRPGPYADRVRALAVAEIRRDEEVAGAERMIAPLLQEICMVVERVAKEASQRPEAEAAFHHAVQAIPPAERGQAAGVSEKSSVLDRGAMCVVEAMPKCSFTLVLSMALQAFSDAGVKLHAAIELERWSPTGNTWDELWRLPPITGTVDDCRAAVGTILAETDAAYKTFDEVRGYSGLHQ
jgi:hypothetical protein